jgi:hypothetical protein
MDYCLLTSVIVIKYTIPFLILYYLFNMYLNLTTPFLWDILFDHWMFTAQHFKTVDRWALNLQILTHVIMIFGTYWKFEVDENNPWSSW